MYKPLYIGMGARIREKRKQMGYTAEKLAELIGISIPFLGDVELGKKALSYPNLLKMCDVLCISPDYILLGKGTEAVTSEHLENIQEILKNMEPQFLPMAEAALVNVVSIINSVKHNKD